nr:MAG TPA: hypothetical protein [Caudoviricetes sp.]
MGLNSKDLNSIMTAGAFAFVSGFLSSLLAQGGFKTDIGWEGLLSMISGAAVAGVNVALYAVYRFFKTDNNDQPKPQA